MKFTEATLYRFDPEEYRMVPARSFAAPEGTVGTGRAGTITLTTSEDHLLGKRAEVRHYSATEVEADGDPRLLDWYALWSPEVLFLDSRIYVTGFMLGMQGRRQDGLCPKHGDPYCADDEDGERFERVQFILA